jgi:hypothetical protein
MLALEPAWVNPAAALRAIAPNCTLAYAGAAMVIADQDAELVRLAQAGNAKAFEALVVKYQRRIARHVARYLRHAADVEDVVQDVFIRAHRGLGAVRGASGFFILV